MKELLKSMFTLALLFAGLMLWSFTSNKPAQPPVRCQHKEYIVLHGDTLQVITTTKTFIHYRKIPTKFKYENREQ